MFVSKAHWMAKADVRLLIDFVLVRESIYLTVEIVIYLLCGAI